MEKGGGNSGADALACREGSGKEKEFSEGRRGPGEVEEGGLKGELFRRFGAKASPPINGS
jgi:hypothetical protein